MPQKSSIDWSSILAPIPEGSYDFKEYEVPYDPRRMADSLFTTPQRNLDCSMAQLNCAIKFIENKTIHSLLLYPRQAAIILEWLKELRDLRNKEEFNVTK